MLIFVVKLYYKKLKTNDCKKLQNKTVTESRPFPAPVAERQQITKRNSTEMDSADITGSARHRDRRAVGTLFCEYSDCMFAYGMKFCTDREVVKDAIQEIFCRLVKGGEGLGEVSNIKGYLLRALRMEVVRQLSHKHFLSINDEQVMFTLQLNEEMLVDRTETEEDDQAQLRRRLLEAINQLSPRQKEAIYLRYIQGIPIEDVADIMNISYQSTRNLLHKALQKLREHFGSVSPLTQTSLVALLMQVFAPLHP